MSQGRSKLLGAFLAVFLAWSLPMQGQEPDVDGSGNGYTDQQRDSIERVDELVGRLQSMPWGPEVVNALSTLGTAACQYDQELGVRAFEAAYAMVAGLDFNLEDDGLEFDPNERSMHILSRLAVTAPRCDPSFRDRPLTREVPGGELRARGLLNATWESLETDPEEAAKFAEEVANGVLMLPAHRQVLFVRQLRQLRQQLPADADGLFRQALSSVAAAGTIRDAFTLGNYVFGALRVPDSGAAQMSVPGGTAYLLSVVRSGLPKELVGQYVGTAIELLLTQGTPTSLDAESLALATQLATWAKTNAPEYSSTLEILLAAQPDSLGIGNRLSEFQEQIERSSASQSLEEELESTVDERIKSRLRFALCMHRIDSGEFKQAEDLLGDLSPELRRILGDFIGLKRASEAIASDSLEAATIDVAGLTDSLHQVLGTLSLASAYWARSVDGMNRSTEDREAAERALRHAIGAVEGVPDHLRPHARIAVAAVLAKCDQGEDAMRALELAMQELSSDQSDGESEEEESKFLVKTYPWGGFSVEIREGDSGHFQNLHPPNLADANFEQAIHRLSSSPEVDLDRLDAVASTAVNPMLRTEGLVAVATGALARAFSAGTE